MKVVLARKEKVGKNRRVVGRTIGENKPRNDVMKDRRPDVMTLQDGGPDVYQDVGQEVTSSKMGGGGEPRLKDHFDDHDQIRCFKNSIILLLC